MSLLFRAKSRLTYWEPCSLHQEPQWFCLSGTIFVILGTFWLRAIGNRNSLFQEPGVSKSRSLLSEPKFVTFGTEIRYFRNPEGTFRLIHQGFTQSVTLLRR